MKKFQVVIQVRSYRGNYDYSMFIKAVSISTVFDKVVDKCDRLGIYKNQDGHYTSFLVKRIQG